MSTARATPSIEHTPERPDRAPGRPHVDVRGRAPRRGYPAFATSCRVVDAAPPCPAVGTAGRSAEHEALLARLHDTTLQALEYIASGGYRDASTFCPEVRSLAGREATALRELIEGAGQRDACQLEQALRRVVGDARTLPPHDIRLTVGPIDDSLPGPVVDAMASATREALTNVRKHAGARSVRVYVEVTEQQALITVKDDGIGVALERLRPGLGLRRSVVGRMDRIGGTASFTSAPGEGMLVTLRWLDHASEAERTAGAP